MTLPPAPTQRASRLTDKAFKTSIDDSEAVPEIETSPLSTSVAAAHSEKVSPHADSTQPKARPNRANKGTPAKPMTAHKNLA